ncbi:MAG: hypothetical protein UHD09_03725 [Bifidobacterium sp.]|nr:hypothetical protein [Bifidobacterium sp.]
MNYYASKEQEPLAEKLTADLRTCYVQELVNVDDVYNRQHLNPGLYADSGDAVVDCLHRTNAAPLSYTVADYARQKKEFQEYWYGRHMGRSATLAEAAGHFDIELDDTRVATCIAGNNDDLFGDLQDYDPPEWYPFGD